jgi:RimJ/RimL family protein N-acetyltransferase
MGTFFNTPQVQTSTSYYPSIGAIQGPNGAAKNFINAIHTERLRLGRFNEGMLWGGVTEKMVGWLNDPDVVRYSEQRHIKHTIETQATYFKHLQRNSGIDYWFIYLNDKERDAPFGLIGSLTVSVIDKPIANIGIMIGDKTAWHHGYALEAMSAIINGLAGEGFKRFEIGTMEENQPMINLAISCGMKEEKRKHGYVYMAAEI